MRLRIGLVLLAATMVGCSSAPKPNVLLITLDTTRADRLGCYGYAKAETPALNGLAAAGARFEHAYAQVPLTLASHATLMTGKYPATTGLRINADAKLAQGVRTLAEGMKERGYRTAAFVSTYILDSIFGLDRGFDVYDDNLVKQGESQHFEIMRRGDATVGSALSWLREGKDEPFFAWVHLYDPHAPYDPPPPFKGRFTEPYDGEIAYTDTQVKRLLEWLASAHKENTLVIVAGDHGESFLEHGEQEHGLFLYDTTIHVPLILVWPKHIAPSVQTANVQLLDVYATVLDLVGAKADPTAPSSSFAAALRGETLPDRIAYGESLYPMLGYGWAPLRYLIQGDLKYIEAPRAELYDRRVDPGETDNKLDKEPRAAELRASLRDLVSRTDIHPPEAPELDAEAQAKLRALGYVGGAAASASTNTSPSGRDPKDMVDIYVGHDRAIVMIKQRRYQDAATLLESLLQRSPESLALYEELGTAYLSLNRLDDALRAYETSLRQVSDDPDRMWGYAEVLRRLGRTDEAISRFERAIARWPSLGEAYLGLSLCYGSRADYAKAYEPARKYAELTPGSKLALGNLANFALGVHKYDDAVETATKLIALDRHWAEGHYVRWEALRAAHKPAEAIAALRDSRESLPSDWLLTCSLAWMLSVTPPAKGSEAATGDEAVRLAQTCVKLNPKHPRSFDVLGAAHAARGSYADAVKAARQALALAAGPQATQARDAIQARIALYDAGQPFRE